MPFTNTNFKNLANEYDTPLYVYSEKNIESQFKNLSSVLKGLKHLICYAVKANSNLSILSFLQQFGSGFDIVSEGELRRVLASGGTADKVVFAGVGKKVAEIEYALASGIKFFNVESAQELKLVAEVAQRMQCTAPVSLRINPDIAVDTHPHLATGLKTSKFGIPLSEISSIWEFIKSQRSLELVAVDCHIGSQLSDIKPLRQAYEGVIKVAKDLEGRGAKISSVDFGGGLGVSFSGHYTPLDLEKFGQMLKKLLDGLSYEVILEPGKYLVAEAGILLTKVLYTKENSEHKFVIVDAGMNDLLRPSLYDAYHEIELVSPQGALIAAANSAEKKVAVDIVGPVCETGCFLARQREMPRIAAGDLLAVKDAGAYGFSMASHYNSRPLPAEVMVSAEGKPRLVRRREAFEDLWKNELIAVSEKR